MNPAEKTFGDRLRKNHQVVISSFQNNTQNHYDFIIDGIRVEFKGPKSVNRGGPIVTERVLVEWQAVLRPDDTPNNVGWVRGKADYIVFDEGDGYLWVSRAELEGLVFPVDWKDFDQRGNYAQDYKAYRRAGRDDLFCYVQRVDIMALPSTKKSLGMPVDL
jgi:hypothetical protein